MVRIHALVAGAVVCLLLAAPVDVYANLTRSPAGGELVTDGARSRTANALRRAVIRRQLHLRGTTWLGRMPSLAQGKRDVLIFIPFGIDAKRPVELIVYMEGFRAFSDEAMDRRHAAGIQELLARDRNVVYVAPDVPPSVHGGNGREKGVYWAARCRSLCGSARAPGDFVTFYEDVRDRVRKVVGTQIELELTLIGFSRGGLGVRSAIEQLAAADGATRLTSVNLRRVVFADALYNRSWLENSWAHLRGLESLREVSLILPTGSYRRGTNNRARAKSFFDRHPEIGLHPRKARHQQSGRFHVHQVRDGHRGIGDSAIYYRPPLPVATSR